MVHSGRLRARRHFDGQRDFLPLPAASVPEEAASASHAPDIGDRTTAQPDEQSPAMRADLSYFEMIHMRPLQKGHMEYTPGPGQVNLFISDRKNNKKAAGEPAAPVVLRATAKW